MRRPWKFFPVDGKVPAVPKGTDWRTVSTSDESTIDAWLNAGLGIALDCEASGVIVIDPDADKKTREPIGDAELQTLEVSNGSLPVTYTVNTPGGGRHLYLDDGGDPIHGRDLAEHVNVRSRGGYVVFDDGREGYRLSLDMPLAPCPAWVRAHVAERATTKAKATADIPLDLPVNIQRAATMLATLPVAVEGAGGDNWTLQVCNKVLDLGLTAATALDVMLEWNERCSPPWGEDELAAKIENALAYRQNDVGAWAVVPLTERFGAALDQLGSVGGEGNDTKPSAFRFYTEAEQNEFEPPRMLVKDLVPEGSLTMFYGRPGSLKSFFTLGLSLSIAGGLDGIEGGPVAYAAGERASSMGKRHRPAWRDHRTITAELPFFLGKRVPLLSQQDQVKEFIAQVKRWAPHPKLVVIDTLARGMAGMDMNDSGECLIAVEALEHIRDRLQCAVIAVHHQSNKDDSGLPMGSSALIGAFDALHSIERDRHTNIMTMKTYLLKDGEERETPWHYKAKAHMQSLVLEPLSAEDASLARSKRSGVAVGPIIQALQAVARPVTTKVLAAELYQGAVDEDASVTVARVSDLEAALNKSALTAELAPYNQGRGAARIWKMPEG